MVGDSGEQGSHQPTVPIAAGLAPSRVGTPAGRYRRCHRADVVGSSPQRCQLPGPSGNVLGAGKPRLIPKLHRHQARVGAHLRGPTYMDESITASSLRPTRRFRKRCPLTPGIPYRFTPPRGQPIRDKQAGESQRRERDNTATAERRVAVCDRPTRKFVARPHRSGLSQPNGIVRATLVANTISPTCTSMGYRTVQ